MPLAPRSARVALGVLLLALTNLTAALAADRPPNVVIFYADDLGAGDLGCYGSRTNPTPNLDRLAREGMRFTSFSTAQAVCSASRAALLTGCYPNRLGILGALGPKSKTALSPDETTLAELLKGRGYATSLFGKWHLGDAPGFLPPSHGFDESHGLPYSNDMWPRHPTNTSFPPLPLIENGAVVQTDPDQRNLTRWTAERSLAFVERHRDRPFFLYVPFSMPHVPLSVSEAGQGRTGHGLYADVIAEIDDAVGQVLARLKALGLEDETLVVFSSDNGPWLSYGDHAGSAGALREGKGTTFEGGVRVPMIARWPGHIPAGTTCAEPAMTIDLMPTIARLADAPLPRPVDGRDLGPLLRGEPGATSPHEALYYYWNRELQAVRSGRWKLHEPHDYQHLKAPGSGGKPGPYVKAHIDRALFDLEADPSESKDVSAEHPEVVARLAALADAARRDLGDSLRGVVGTGVREPGRP